LAKTDMKAAMAFIPAKAAKSHYSKDEVLSISI
jgi:hypothetical protein